MHRAAAILASVGLIVMTMLGWQMYSAGTHSIVYVLVPGAMMLFSFYALFFQRKQ